MTVVMIVFLSMTAALQARKSFIDLRSIWWKQKVAYSEQLPRCPISGMLLKYFAVDICRISRTQLEQLMDTPLLIATRDRKLYSTGARIFFPTTKNIRY